MASKGFEHEILYETIIIVLAVSAMLYIAYRILKGGG